MESARAGDFVLSHSSENSRGGESNANDQRIGHIIAVKIRRNLHTPGNLPLSLNWPAATSSLIQVSPNAGHAAPVSFRSLQPLLYAFAAGELRQPTKYATTFVGNPQVHLTLTLFSVSCTDLKYSPTVELGDPG
jgi:hypothetical protein